MKRPSSKLFLITVFCVVALMVSAAWVWAVKGKMWFLNPEYPMWLATIQMLDTCDVGETAVLGDSRAKAALVPSLISNTTVNLSVGGASPIETYGAVQSILKCANPPKRVILAFSPVYFTDIQVYWERSAAFNYLNFDQMEDVRKESLRLNDSTLYPVSAFHSSLYRVTNYSYSVSFPSYYFAAMVDSGFIGRKARNDLELELTLANRGQHLFGTAPRSDWHADEGLLEGFLPLPLSDFYFNKALDALGEKGIAVYFAGTPINDATRVRMNPNFVREYLDYINALRARHPHFVVLGDPIPYLPNENFGDAEHLNAAGSKAFSESVAKSLASAIAQEPHGVPR